MGIFSCRCRTSLRVAEYFNRVESREFGDGERGDCLGDGAPLHGVGEGEGEVALYGLEARELARGGAAQRQTVERIEVELGEEDGLAQLACLALGGGQLAEAGDGCAVEQSCGAAARLEPRGRVRREGERRGGAGGERVHGCGKEARAAIR